MEKLKGKKDGTSKQKIIQGKGGQTIITAQYWDKELRITVSGGWSKSTLEEVEGLMKALIEVGPATIKGEVFKGRLPRQFALTKYGVADHQAVTEWHNFPFPVKMITLYFS